MLTDEYYTGLFTEPLEIDTPEKAERFVDALERAKAIAEGRSDEETEEHNTKEKYAQRAELSASDFNLFCEILLRNGYEVRCQLDTECNIVIIEYLHTEYTGHSFQETEC